MFVSVCFVGGHSPGDDGFIPGVTSTAAMTAAAWRVQWRVLQLWVSQSSRYMYGHESDSTKYGHETFALISHSQTLLESGTLLTIIITYTFTIHFHRI